jgi:putative oxidoreductase
MKIALWIAQIFLAALLIWTAYTKLLTPADELAAMWPWTGEHPVLNKVTGVLDLLAGIGLIFPVLLNIQPKLTVYAAYGVIALMISGIVFHVSRGEAPVTGFNVFVIAVAVFIAWGRSRNAS